MKQEQKHIPLIRISAAFVSIFFVAIISYLLGISICTVLIDYYPYTLSIPAFYQVVFTILIYKALTIRKKNSHKTVLKEEERKQIETIWKGHEAYICRDKK